jgi:hypothetical protein
MPCRSIPMTCSRWPTAILRALEMPDDEQAARMHRMRTMVKDHNVYRWAANLLSDLTDIRIDAPERPETPVLPGEEPRKYAHDQDRTDCARTISVLYARAPLRGLAHKPLVRYANFSMAWRAVRTNPFITIWCGARERRIVECELPERFCQMAGRSRELRRLVGTSGRIG